MSSKAKTDLDDLMLMVDSMESPEEEPKQEVDKEIDEPSSEGDDMDSEKNSEPIDSGEQPPEEVIGLNTDKVDYPDDSQDEQEMDSEAGKLPELTDIRDGGDWEGENDEYDKEYSSQETSKNSDKINSLKKNSTSGMIEFITKSFQEENPEHSVCCVMKDKVISLKDEEAYETLYTSGDDSVEFGVSVRNRELEEQKETNDDMIEKLLKFDNI